MPVDSTEFIPFIIPVDVAKFHNHVNEALAKGQQGKGCCGQSEVAFRYLQSQRRFPGKSLDISLAAAEHYMFSRWLVCSGKVSSFQMRIIVIGYDVKKLLDFALGDPNKMKTTGNPVSPPNFWVVLWGLEGVKDGEKTHNKCNNQIQPPRWIPIEEILGKAISPLLRPIEEILY